MPNFMLILAVLAIAIGNCRGTIAAGQEVPGIKCIIDGSKNINRQFFATYAEGKVYFSSNRHKQEFLSDPQPHRLKANHQLLLTGQYAQTQCPISNQRVNSKLTALVAGVEIAFCCEQCKQQVVDANDAKSKAKLVFANAVFKNSFGKVSAKIDLTGVTGVADPNAPARQNWFTDFESGRVFFSSELNREMFLKNSKRFARAARRQLVQTGQFVQTQCPISGHGAAELGHEVDVGGLAVRVCCRHCQQQIKEAVDTDARLKLVFDDLPFKKSFVKREF